MSLALAVQPVTADRHGAGTGVKPIDTTYLRRFTLGNSDLEREVLGLFAEHAPGYLDQLRRAGSAKAWHDAAHTLKGSARAVGAWRVARSAEAAERLDFAAIGERRLNALDLIQDALDEATAYIDELA